MSLPQGIRVLSVEDDKVNQMVIARVLKKFGCGISACNSSEDALSGLQQLHATSGFEQFPHVILMDLNLPGINGVQATSAIRQLYPGHPVSIIMLTGECSQEAINECTAAGCNGFLTKPLKANDLTNAIKQCLGC